jgi:hypothetical protein
MVIRFLGGLAMSPSAVADKGALGVRSQMAGIRSNLPRRSTAVIEPNLPFPVDAGNDAAAAPHSSGNVDNSQVGFG